MKEKYQKAVFSRITVTVFAVLAAIIPLFFFSHRNNQHIFLEKDVFIGFSQVMFWLMMANALVSMIWAALVFKKRDVPEAHPLPFTIAFTVTYVLTIAALIFEIVQISLASIETRPAIFTSVAKLLPFALLYLAVAFFIIWFPEIKNKAARITVVSVVVFGMLLGTVFAIYSPVVYDFSTTPMVIDTGEDYSVVFATNDDGTGFVEYEYGGEVYRVYDQKQGKIESDSRIHTISVPYEHLDNNSYSVGSEQIYEPYAYGSRSGKTIISQEYTFTPCRKDTQKWLCISDWHTRNELAVNAVAHMGEYDGVILLGDAAADLRDEDAAVKYLIDFGGELSGGTKPVIYVRGNHDTRGAFAPYLADALGLDEFYYTVQSGDYRFVVLDCAEDKEDSHIEYGGLADFESYRARQTEWAETLTEEGKTIALCHSPTLFFEEDLSDRAAASLMSIKTSLLISGHWHYCDFDTERYENMPLFIDGGHGDTTFTAGCIVISPNGIEISACNDDGETLLSRHVDWLNR